MPAILRHKYKIFLMTLLIITAYFIWPVYGFYAYNLEKLPLSPFGWQSLPSKAPQSQKLYDPSYQQAANITLSAMEAKRQALGAASFSVAVGVKGKLVWSGATGWSNLKDNLPATSKSRYRIGSTSKAITATLLARLVQQGKIDLDLPINQYMKDLSNQRWQDITPRMLASHTAGIPHYAQKVKEKDYLGLYHSIALQSHYDSVVQALDVFDSAALKFKPGHSFSYSSLGTVLLSAAIEQATNTPYLQALEQEVLNPLGITTIAPAPYDYNDLDHMTVSYKNRMHDGQPQIRPWRDVNLSHRLAGGGLSATSSDLVKVGMAYFNSDFLSPGIVRTFWTPQKLKNGQINEQDYALGWRVKSWPVNGMGTVHNINHGGVSRGAQSWLLIFPDHEMVIAINANIKTKKFSDFGLLYQDIFRAFAANDQK